MSNCQTVELMGFVKYCLACNHAEFQHQGSCIAMDGSTAPCKCEAFVGGGVPFAEALTEAKAAVADMVNHPPHYKNHPSGVECIVITEHMNFCLGNAMKYIWRAGEKGHLVQDLEKARWYLDREIARLKKFGLQ